MLVIQRLAYLIPRSRVLYYWCKVYVDKYQGQNDKDMLRNGEVHCLAQALSPTRKNVVFDVGANQGMWTEHVLTLYPNVEIHCFEPSPTTFSLLESQSFPDSVKLNNIGLGSKRETAELYVFSRSSELSSLYPQSDHEIQGKETVQIDTLSFYCTSNLISHIDYLKIDVEGYELEVLKGALPLLAQRAISFIQFEYGVTYLNARNLLKDVADLMQEYDYDLFKIMPNGLRRVERYTPSLETFVYANYIYKLRSA